MAINHDLDAITEGDDDETTMHVLAIVSAVVAIILLVIGALTINSTVGRPEHMQAYIAGVGAVGAGLVFGLGSAGAAGFRRSIRRADQNQHSIELTQNLVAEFITGRAQDELGRRRSIG